MANLEWSRALVFFAIAKMKKSLDGSRLF